MTEEQFLKHRLTIRLNFSLSDNSKIQKMLATIDGYKTAWSLTADFSPEFLKSLEISTLVSSTGSSTRIEGSKLSDDQVELFLRQTKMRKLETRDEQEVAGYLEMMRQIFDTYKEIELSERTIKQIHSVLLRYSVKDDKHRGGYKTQSNQVVAIDDQSKVVGIIFDPSTPENTPKEMTELLEWVIEALRNGIIHPLIILANFIFEFLSIHPFKDGNGRVSRVLTNLILLQQEYIFTKYIAHEKLVENTKVEYYMALRKATNSWKTEKEDVTPWLFYFLDVVRQQGDKAMLLTKQESTQNLLNENQLKVYNLFLNNYPELLGRKEISNQTGISIKTVEAIIKRLLVLKKIEKQGQGSGTKYILKR